MSREGEREREPQINRSREREIGQKWKRLGSGMAISENGHLSIFSKANQ